MSRSFLREVVLRSPQRVILGGQVSSPGAVVIVAAAAFLSDLGERVAGHRVAVQKDRTVAAYLVETRPRRLKRFPVMLRAPSREFAVLFNLHAQDAVNALGYGIRRMPTTLKTRNERAITN